MKITLPNVTHTINRSLGLWVIALMVTFTLSAFTAGATNCVSSNITITLKLDNYPGETYWKIKNSSNQVVKSGGTYGWANCGQTLSKSFTLPNDDYKFIIYDCYGDGICCSYGHGWYTLVDDNGTVIASGGEFGSSETTYFCVGGCSNVTSGGTISSAESACGPYDPSNILNTCYPGGGSGTIEYMWLKSTDLNLPISQWTVISGANGSTYNPGEISETTHYLRCSRRSGCSDWNGESNIITKTVTGPCAQVCDNSLITNPGFENGMDGWSIWSSCGAYSQSDYKHSGSKAAKIPSPGGFGQNLGYVAPCNTVTLTAWGKTHGTMNAFFEIKGKDSNGNTISNEYIVITKNSGFNEFSISYVVPEGAAWVDVLVWRSNDGESGNVFVDDFCVTIEENECPTEVCENNLMTNSGFESGTTGWVQWGGELSIVSNSNSGSNALKLKDQGGVAQNFYSLSAGDTYTLTGYGFKTQSDWGGFGLKVWDNGYNNVLAEEAVSITSQSSYEQYTVTLTIPAGAHVLETYAWWNTDEDALYIDDLCLTVEQGSGITPPTALTCAPSGTISWTNNIVIDQDGNTSGDVRFIRTGTTQYDITPATMPSEFDGSVDITISEAVAYDAYPNRASTGSQPDERFRVVFLNNGSVVHSSPYTGISSSDDGLATGIIQAEWLGSLGSTVNLPNGADQILLVHYNDATYGEGQGASSSANSLFPSGVCIEFEEAPVITPPTAMTCAPSGTLAWTNNIVINANGSIDEDVIFYRTGVTTYDITPASLPTEFDGSVDINITEAVAWDGYLNRASTSDQPDERYKVVFLKNGNVIHNSPYTGVSSSDDGLETGTISAEWIGSLGTTTNLPNGADQILLVHFSDVTYGEGAAAGSSQNSVYPSGVCISYSASVGSIAGSVQDKSGNPLVNVPIALYADVDQNGVADSGTPILTTSTGTDGTYSFPTVASGDYVVVETNLPTWLDYSDSQSADGDVVPNSNTNDNIIPVTVSSGENDIANDFVDNLVPTASDDYATVDQGVSTFIPVGVNDTQGNDCTEQPITILTAPANGSITGWRIYPNTSNPVDNKIEYQSNADFVGIDSFEYQIGDCDGDYASAWVYVTVIVPTGSIAGSVSDDNGTALVNVTVELFADADEDGVADSATPIETDMTDGSGNYEFLDVAPGSYVVVETNLPDYSNVSDTQSADGDVVANTETTDDIIPVTVTPGEDDVNNDFVDAFNDASIGDYVWNDTNGNGIQDDGPTGIDGVPVKLTEAGPDAFFGTADDVITTQVTSGGGAYDFTGLPAGLYRVEVDETSAPLAALGLSTNNNPTGVALDHHDDYNDADFGFTSDGGSISGNVRTDEDVNIDMVSVELYADANADGVADSATPVDTELTDTDGNYEFTDVAPGNYIVVEVQPAGYESVSEGDASTATVVTLAGDGTFQTMPNGSDSESAQLSAGSDLAVVVVNFATLDEGAGVSINGTTIFAPVTLDAGLNFSSGDFTTPWIAHNTEDHRLMVEMDFTTGETSFFGTIELDSEPTELVPNFTVNPLPAVAAGSLVEVTVTNINTSGPGGDSGTFEVYEYTGVPVNDYDAVADTPGDDAIPVTVAPYEPDADNDFIEMLEENSTIGDFVWNDTNQDGVQDAGELGIANVDVNLIGAGADGIINTGDDVILDTKTTDGNGFYEFADLAAGDYIVDVDDTSTALDGLALTTGNDPLIVNLPANTNYNEADFGYYEAQPSGVIAILHSIVPTQITVPNGNVVFNYLVRNVGPVDLTSITLSGGLECPIAPGTAPLSGDNNSDGILNPGENWLFRCTRNDYTWSEPEVIPNPVSVEGTDPGGFIATASATANVNLVGNNMEVLVDKTSVCPGDTIHVTLVTRYMSYYAYGQFAHVGWGCDVYDNGAAQTGGPGHITFTDNDASSTLPGALTPAIDQNDDADFGGVWPDWVHEFDYIVPMSQTEDFLITAYDEGLIRSFHPEDSTWTESNSLMATDVALISVCSGGGSSMVVSNEQSVHNTTSTAVISGPIDGYAFNPPVKSGAQIKYKSGDTREKLVYNNIMDLQAFPNPTIQRIEIGFDGFYGGEYTLMDLRGKVLRSGQIDQEKMEFNLENLDSGTYLIKAVNGERNGLAKVVKL